MNTDAKSLEMKLERFSRPSKYQSKNLCTSFHSTRRMTKIMSRKKAIIHVINTILIIETEGIDHVLTREREVIGIETTLLKDVIRATRGLGHLEEGITTSVIIEIETIVTGEMIITREIDNIVDVEFHFQSNT